jgi:hypothetical protein
LTDSIKNIFLKKFTSGENNHKTKLSDEVGARLTVNYRNEKTKK